MIYESFGASYWAVNWPVLSLAEEGRMLGGVIDIGVGVGDISTPRALRPAQNPQHTH